MRIVGAVVQSERVAVVLFVGASGAGNASPLVYRWPRSVAARRACASVGGRSEIADGEDLVEGEVGSGERDADAESDVDGDIEVDHPRARAGPGERRLLVGQVWPGAVQRSGIGPQREVVGDVVAGHLEHAAGRRATRGT